MNQIFGGHGSGKDKQRCSCPLIDYLRATMFVCSHFLVQGLLRWSPTYGLHRIPKGKALISFVTSGMLISYSDQQRDNLCLVWGHHVLRSFECAQNNVHDLAHMHAHPLWWYVAIQFWQGLLCSCLGSMLIHSNSPSSWCIYSCTEPPVNRTLCILPSSSCLGSPMPDAIGKSVFRYLCLLQVARGFQGLSALSNVSLLMPEQILHFKYLFSAMFRWVIYGVNLGAAPSPVVFP